MQNYYYLFSIFRTAKIADYLDKQTSKIDRAIALKTAHIEKLKEYKSVLINDGDRQGAAIGESAVKKIRWILNIGATTWA